MAVRNDLSVNFDVSPRIITVASPSTEITMQDALDTLRTIEASAGAVDNKSLIDAAGKESLGGGTEVGLTLTLQNALLAFQSRITPQESGTATSTGTTSLVDTAALFVTKNVLPGGMVINFTDFSLSTVIKVISETELLIQILEGGTNNDWTVGDAYRVYNEIQCNMSGGNMVAVDGVGASIDPVFPTVGTQIIRSSSSSATIQNQSLLETATFIGKEGLGISVSPLTGTDSAVYPVGNTETPCKTETNIKDIEAVRGFRNIYVRENITLTQDHSDDTNVWFGDNPQTSVITVGDRATYPDKNLTQAKFQDAFIQGELDSNNIIWECITGVLTDANGFIYKSAINGKITVAGATSINKCWISPTAVGSQFELDFNNQAIEVYISQWEQGKCLVTNMPAGAIMHMTGTAGRLIIDASCDSAAEIACGGAIILTNNSNVAVLDSTVPTVTTKYLERATWIDTEQVAAGVGSQRSPFNNLTNSIDFAEQEGIKKLNIYADILLDRLVKNFVINGIGQPTVDCNGQNLTKSEFLHCKLEGVALGDITIQQGVLLASLEFNGFAEKCAIAGDITINGPTHIMESYSNAPGAAYSSITTGSNILQVSDWHRSLGIKGMTGGTHTIEMYGGQLHLDAACTGGTIYLRGNYSVKPDDLSNGTVIIDQTENEETWTNEKALSVDNYIGLS